VEDYVGTECEFLSYPSIQMFYFFSCGGLTNAVSPFLKPKKDQILQKHEFAGNQPLDPVEGPSSSSGAGGRGCGRGRGDGEGSPVLMIPAPNHQRSTADCGYASSDIPRRPPRSRRRSSLPASESSARTSELDLLNIFTCPDPLTGTSGGIPQPMTMPIIPRPVQITHIRMMMTTMIRCRAVVVW
jgi:hypothetical protein